MTRLKRLIVEAHRRSLWQVLGIYMVTSWVGYQVVLGLADGIGLPDWVPGFAIVLFVIGLPIVVGTAFVQEGGPLPRSRPLDSPEPDPTLFGDVAVEPRTPAAFGAPVRHHFLLTWQRSLLAGISAFLLLGITAGGYVGMRSAGIGPFGTLVATGVLDAQAPVLVAEFTPTNTDSVLAMAISQAFRAALAQSDAVHVVSPTQVRGTLQRMGRPDAQLDVTLAREVAEREGVRAVAVGDVMQAGGRYTISVSLIAPDGSTLLPALKENAADASDVLDAVDRLGKRVRERIGEHYRSLRRSAPLSAVTTPSLEALRRYTLGAHAYDAERKHDVAIALLEEAVVLDSTFAMAWRKLAAVYSSSSAGRARVVHAATKAYENRERLSEAERYQAVAFYHMNVTEDLQKALAAYRALLEISPGDVSLNNMGILYGRLGEYEHAIDAYRRAIATDSMLSHPYLNIMSPLVALERWDEAEQNVATYERRFGANTPDALWMRAGFAAVRGDHDAAERHTRQLAATAGASNPLWRGRAAQALAELASTRGRLTEAAAHDRDNIRNARERGLLGRALEFEAASAARTLYVKGNVVAALRELDAAASDAQLRQIPPLDRPYLPIVLFYADAGQVARARQVMLQYETEVEEDERGERRMTLGYMRAAIAMAEQKYDAALQELQALTSLDPCRICPLEMLGRAHEGAGRADSAALYYQKYADQPDLSRTLYFDGYLLAAVLERLTDLYLTLGRPQDAAAAAGRFVQLWERADAALQPRVRAKQELLARLQERGARD